MTNEERAVVIPLEVDLEFADRIERELLRDHPPYTGTKDHNPTTEENAALIIRRLARRLREQGERIEGYVELRTFRIAEEAKSEARMRHVTFFTFKALKSNEIERPATLIIHPQEGESDE